MFYGKDRLASQIGYRYFYNTKTAVFATLSTIERATLYPSKTMLTKLACLSRVIILQEAFTAISVSL